MKKILLRLLLIILFANKLFPQIEAKMIAKNFDTQIYIKNNPGYINRLLVVEQGGIIKIIEKKSVLDIPFLDISDRTHQPIYPGDEMGMLGLAFDPNFEINKYFYVNYVDEDDFTIISRFIVKNKLGNAD